MTHKTGGMMTGQCCAGGRFSRAAASIVPAAVLVLLPKCPLCLAVWLTVATGISIPASDTAWLRPSVALLWVAGLAWVIWHRVYEKRRKVWSR